MYLRAEQNGSSWNGVLFGTAQNRPDWNISDMRVRIETVLLVYESIGRSWIQGGRLIHIT